MIQKNLFISNFNKILKRIGMAAVIVAAGIGACLLLNYLYVEEYQWGRKLWHDYYSEEENIDYLYIGSSHVYNDINPFLLDELNGGNNFNLSTGSQRLNGTYYLLKEADREQNLEHVYVELYYDLQTGKSGNFFERASVSNNWRNTDYMKPSFNKLEYILTMSKSDKYLDTLFPFVRFRKKLFDMEYIGSQVQIKKEEEYQNYQYDIIEEARERHSVGKGFMCLIGEISERGAFFRQSKKLEENAVSEDAQSYLRKIMEYCRHEGIELTFFSSPIYELQVLSTGDYDRYVNQIREIASEYGIEYYDFNLCKEEYLPIQDRKYFWNMGHLNSEGSQMYTAFFHKVMQGTKEESENYFYSSYEEKLRMSSAQIYGIIQLQPEAESENGERYLMAASNRSDGMEYRIFITPNEEETVMVQDFSPNPFFCVSEKEHGICTIVAREKGGKEVHTIEVGY